MKNNFKIGFSTFLLFFFAIIAYSSTEEDKQEEKSKDAISTVKVGDLEVMTKNIGMLTWNEAMQEAKKQGDGWHVPTRDELVTIYENRDWVPNIGAYDVYWTSEEEDRYNAVLMMFDSGQISYNEKNAHNSVRLVRTK